MKEVAIGVDIGGTNTKYGMIDRNGNCLAAGHISTTDFEDVDPYLKALYQSIEKTRKENNLKLDIKGIGIGAPNGNYYSGTIEFAPNLKWKGVIHLVELLKKYYDLPIFLTNDANAAAIGEMIYGGAKGMRDLIIITLGTGLGSGIVVNGELVYGHDGFAGEIGHTIVYHDGRLCGCGRKGCLETYASATGIKRTVIELLENSTRKSELRKYKSIDEMHGSMIEKAARRGDKIAIEAFEFTGKVLGFQLANTVAHTSPEAIFLFGGLAQAGDCIFEPTKRYMEENMLNIFRNKVKLLPSALEGADAAVFGASALVWKELDK